MSTDYRIMYKILRLLQKWRGREDFDVEIISAKAMGVEYAYWEQVLIEMQEAGYIKGLVIEQSLSEMYPHIVEPIKPRITSLGVDFLETNSAMQKIKDALRLAGEII